MPFVSKKQEAWAFATKQPFAKKWADMTDQSSLPKKVDDNDGDEAKKPTKKIRIRVKKKQ
jgi:hypothetical protein